MTKGALIVIEGIDGSGKETQWKKLTSRLEQECYKVKTYDFPRYGKPSAQNVEKYLRGEFGPKESIDPKRVSSFYAEDRISVAQEINEHLKNGFLVVCNRYTTANAGHQTIRYQSRAEQEEFIEWLFDYEYNKLKIPKPDTVIILDVTPEISQKNVSKKGAREYTHGMTWDIHEKDPEHLGNARDVFCWLTEKYPDWYLIDCMANGDIKSRQEIHELVWEIVEPMLKPEYKL